MNSFILPSFVLVVFCLMMLTSCQKEQIPQYTIQLTLPDGTQETHVMMAGSTLMVRDSILHTMIKVMESQDSTMALEVTHYTTLMDTTTKEATIQKMESGEQRLRQNNSLSFPAGGKIKATVASMMLIDPSKIPQGICQGICCTATCWSQICCGDEFECKNVPCKCDSPSNCPQPNPPSISSRVIEMYRDKMDRAVVRLN